ncbi:MAG: cytochrome c [Candidatus Obscuribacterales bacterium]|nr:cytochrome c [Candidatus Obscuribacterales bacterium]
MMKFPACSSYVLSSLCLSLLSCTLLSSCQLPNSSEEPFSLIQSKAAQTDKTKSDAIELNHDEPEFPPGPGHDLFVKRCIVCHSLRYISMQPDFPEKTWKKEVEKMQQTWGAHISDEEAHEIIQYLTRVKGVKP